MNADTVETSKSGTAAANQKSRPPEKSYRMCAGVVHLPDHGTFRKTMIDVLRGQIVTEFNVAIQRIMAELGGSLEIVFDDKGQIASARLLVGIAGDDIPRAEKLLAQPMTDFGYVNSYRLILIQRQENGRAIATFEIAAARMFEGKKGKRRVLNAMPANFLAQVIMTWCRYEELKKLHPSNAKGLAQKIAEQVLSFIQLRDSEADTAFPSIDQRSPEAKRSQWLESLNRVAGNWTGFEYKRARDIDPTIPEEDPRGNRRVNVDPDWITVTKLDKVSRFPVSFANNDIVVYRRHTNPQAKAEADRVRLPDGSLPKHIRNKSYESDEGRLYALIPVVEITHKRQQWWLERKHEFEALPAFGPRTWPKNNKALMVPLEYRDNLNMLWEPNRRVKWSIIAEEDDHKFRHGKRMNNLPFLGTRWLVKFATETEVTFQTTGATLGFHLHEENATLLVVWSLEKEGLIIESGEFLQTEILDYALVKKKYMESLQRSHRWVGGMKFRAELKRRTDNLAQRIVALAAEKKAEIVFEDLSYVQKQGQGPDLNSKRSMWNYADLITRVEFFAKDRFGLPTRRVNEYQLKFTCPACGAIRKAGETKETATTYIERNDASQVLHCRKCGTETLLDKRYFADKVALSKK